MNDDVALALVKLFGRRGGDAGLDADEWGAVDRWLSATVYARGLGNDWMDTYYDRDMITDGQLTDMYAKLGMERRVKPLEGGLRMITFHEKDATS